MINHITAADALPRNTTLPEAINIDRIQRMLDDCDTSNRNDLLMIAIEALIDRGVDTGPRIVGAAASMGFKRAHAGAVLSKSEGGSPDRHRWQRGSDGIYRLHPNLLAA